MGGQLQRLGRHGPGGTATTWIELPTAPSMPKLVRPGGRHYDQGNLTLDVLLAMDDETGRLAQAEAKQGLKGSEDGAAPATD